MGVPRLDKVVTNAIRGIGRRAAEVSGSTIADIRDTGVRVAYVNMYEDLNIKKEEILDLESSDITNIITPDFPKTVRNKGCVWTSNNIPWYAKDNKSIAFRAELRKGQGEAKEKYLAMLWESTGNRKRCKIYYRTDYSPFSLDNRTAHKRD